MLDDDIHNLDCIDTTFEDRNPSAFQVQSSICDKNNLPTVAEDVEPAPQSQVIFRWILFFIYFLFKGWMHYCKYYSRYTRV